MEKISIDFENCYGIKALKHEFNLSKGNAFIIYAPNGSMKSSFAKTFTDISQDNQPSDRIFPHRLSKYSITDENGDTIPKERIYVVEPYVDNFTASRTSTLLVNDELRKRFEVSIKSINDKIDAILLQLSKNSKKSKNTIQPEISNAFYAFGQDFYQILVYISIKINQERNPGLGDIIYNEVINDKVVNFLSSPSVQQQLIEYIDRYNELIAQSSYFKRGIFDHTNAEDLNKSLKDNGYFAADHALLLTGQDAQKTTVSSQDEFNKTIEAEKQHILGDPKLAEKFKAIDTAITKNSELRKFRRYLQDHPILLSELANIDELKRKLWVSYSYTMKSELLDFVETYNEAKLEIEKVIETAKEQETEWKNVVSIFRERFSVPFSLRIMNQEDVILKNAAPSLIFTYIDENDPSESREIGRNDLISVLSTGENRALYLLNIIFEIQSLIKEHEQTILVLDDIADSFDYKNKYAIIEYINSIVESKKFIVIILTHNFDFYRTVQSRLSLHRGHNCLMAIKSPAGISLEKAEYLNPFDYWREVLNSIDLICTDLGCNKKICKKKKCDQEILIAIIPMIRNLVEYMEGVNSEDYLMLTSLLHIKPLTNNFRISELLRITNRIIGTTIQGVSSDFVINLIYNQAELCLADSESINFENKIILSIAIRLIAEQIMIKQINDQVFVENIKSNQTIELYKRFKDLFPKESAKISLLDKVVLMTPETIHLNSFMYEPILDLSDHHLKSLYIDLKHLVN